MKLTIEATATELHDKGEQLVRAMMAELSAVRPDLAEQLAKAIEPVRAWTSNATYPALREIEQHTNAAYLTTLDEILADIFAVLDEKPSNAPEVKALQKAHEWHARERVIAQLVATGAPRASLTRLSLGELLQRAHTDL